MDKNEIDILVNQVESLGFQDIEEMGYEKQQEILDKINKFLEQEPLNTDILYCKGCFYFAKKDYITAKQTFEKILQITSDKDLKKAIKGLIETCDEVMFTESEKVESCDEIKLARTEMLDNCSQSDDVLIKIPCELLLCIKLILILIVFCIFILPLLNL